jgi:hypothetical protein
MNLKNLFFCFTWLLVFCGIGRSLSAQTTIADLPAPLEFCEGDSLLKTLTPPVSSGDYIAGSGVWTINKVVIPDNYTCHITIRRGYYITGFRY